MSGNRDMTEWQPRRHRHHHPHTAALDGEGHDPCVDCPAGIFPLSMAPCDECLRLVGIEGGRLLRKRLAELGLNAGSEVRVLQSHGGGPMILAVREDARMAIGRGMAHKILVTAANGNTNSSKGQR